MKKMENKLFGCKVNNYFLNQWTTYFDINGNYHKNSIIIASCEVTDRAKKKYIKEVIHQINKGKYIYLTGCGTIKKGKKISENIFYNRYPQLKIYQKNITLLPERPPQNTNIQIQQKNNTMTRKPIIIQTGCDNHCSFCLTIQKRGKHQNRPLSEIITEIQNFENNGGQEIVITGINLASRGCSNTKTPKETQFHYLLQKILQETSIQRIRISSLGPEYITDNFFQTISNPRIMPHFHFSIQSFSNNILKSMNRNYNSQKLDRILTNIKKIYNTNSNNIFSNQNISIGADIITGFPGETEKDFLQTYQSITKYGITKIHAFPFSSHQIGEQIPASKLPNQINPEIKKHRNQKLIKEGNKIRDIFIQEQKGQKFQILLEQKKNGFRYGRTPNYIQIKLQGNFKQNQIITHTI